MNSPMVVLRLISNGHRHTALGGNGLRHMSGLHSGALENAGSQGGVPSPPKRIHSTGLLADRTSHLARRLHPCTVKKALIVLSGHSGRSRACVSGEAYGTALAANPSLHFAVGAAQEVRLRSLISLSMCSRCEDSPPTQSDKDHFRLHEHFPCVLG